MYLRPMRTDARSGPTLPFLVVFLSSACVMVIELVASRLIALHVGSNLYTWTSIIAVVLTGLTVGNLAGGALADRVGRRAGALLAWLLVAAGFSSLAIVVAVDPVFAGTVANLPLASRALLGVAIVFFVPAAVLGAVSPLAATWAISTRARLGFTVGTLYAVGSFGAIVGTLLTGFVLIAYVGSIAIMVGVAAVLALCGLTVHRRLPTLVGAVFVLTVAGVVLVGRPTWIPAAAAEHGEVVYVAETRYQTVAVAHDPWTGARTVVLDNLVHGFVVPEDPTLLVYPYIAAYAAAHEVARERAGRPLRSLHLGGGAFTLPRFVAAAFAGDEIVAVEIDPGVTMANHAAAGLPLPPPFEVVHADAREAVRDLAGAGRTFDLVYADAFTDYSIPYHLATVGFYRQLRAVLADDGAVLFNVIDDPRFPRMLASLVATAGVVFERVEVLAMGPDSDENARNTFVVVAGSGDLTAREVVDRAAAGGLEVAVRVAADLAGRLGGRPPVVLTDAFAPVERLVAHLYGR